MAEVVAEPRRRRYTRAEMEGMMPPDPDLQQKLWWSSVYRTLDPVVAREYDALCAPAQHRCGDGRNQSSRKRKEDVVVADVGRSCALVNHTEDGGKRTSKPDAYHIAGCDDLGNECDPVTTEKSLHEEDDSDEEYNSIQRLAFLVEGEPNFESGPPEDGLEYLRRVRWEATQLPRVKVVKFDMKSKEQTPYMPKIPEIAKCPEELLPVKDWVVMFLADFAKLREVFSQLDSPKEDQSLCTPRSKNPDAAEGANQLNDLPTVSSILAMSAVSRATMLRKHISEFENEDTLSRSNCLWLFALCAAVDAPLDADMCATMRSLLRKCSSLIASRSDPDDDEVAMLNILTVISGNYFGQSERNSS